MRLTDRRLGAERRIRGAHDRGGGQLADGDVIGMAIRAFRAERDDDLGSDPAKVSGDFPIASAVSTSIERAIRIVEEPDFSEAQLFGGRQQLGLTRLADDVRSRRLLAVSEPAALASGRRHQIGRHSLGRTFCQRPSVPNDSSSGCASTHMSRSSEARAPKRDLTLTATAYRFKRRSDHGRGGDSYAGRRDPRA